MENIKKLADRKYRVRFKYRDTLTGNQKVYQQTLNNVTLEQAVRHRDDAKVQTSQRIQAAVRLNDYVESFLIARVDRGRRGKKLASATVKRDARSLDFVLPWCGDWIVTEITRRDVDRLVDDWLKATKENGELYSRHSLKNCLKALRLLMRFACEDLGIDSPADLVENIIAESPPKTALTMLQMQFLLESVKAHRPDYYAMTLLGFITGTRFASLSALSWHDIDKRNKVIRFTKSVYEGVVKTGDKVGKTLIFPLLPELEEVLDWHRKSLMRQQHAGLASGLVFPARRRLEIAERNGYMTAGAFNDALKHCCKKANVPKITSHNLRHTLNTLALEVGVSGELLRKVTGHQDERMTQHYFHPHADAMAKSFGPILVSAIGEE